jgi:hypothetical protein
LRYEASRYSVVTKAREQEEVKMIKKKMKKKMMTKKRRLNPLISSLLSHMRISLVMRNMQNIKMANTQIRYVVT